MGYLPEFEGESSFIEGSKTSRSIQTIRVERKPPRQELADKILPESERLMPIARDRILVKEDQDIVAWERLLRQFLHRLATGRAHRTSAVLVWEWATGLDVREEWKKKNSGVYARDLRILNTLLRAYFGDSRISFIDGRKFNKVYDVSASFYLDRKAPHCLSLYLEWKQGLKVR